MIMRQLFLFIFCCSFSFAAFSQPNENARPQTIISYSMGFYAPFGIRIAEEMPSGFAGYLTGRCNLPAFTPDKYTIKNGRINDSEWTWTYLDKKKYARAEIYVGFQLPIIKPQEMLGINRKIGLTFWMSGGMLYARYLYQYDRAEKNLGSSSFWVRDLDQGGVGFDMEAGVQVRYGHWRFHFGNSAFFHRTEPMFVGGFGWVMKER